MRVLVIEERETVLRALTASLTQAEMGEVLGTTDPLRALDLIRLWQPEAVILEVKRRDGLGMQLCRVIRESAPQIQLLVVTSYPDPLERLAAMKAGADAYLMKELDLAELVTRLHIGSSPTNNGG
ncbi:MAG: response regulator [Bacillota bacterium]